MDLADFSNAHGGFYAPSYLVKVAGHSLTHEVGAGVTQVEVDRTLGAAGRFSFTIVNAFDLEKRMFVTGDGRKLLDVLTFGAPIEVFLGYGAFSTLPKLIEGVVTEITTSFSEGGTPELVVSGYDHLFPMTLGKQSRPWTK